MHWKFWQREERQAEDGYSGIVSRALQQAADGGDRKFRTSVVESCAGLWSRAFASAEVSGTSAVKARMLADIGRRLCETGESVYVVSVEGGILMLEPAHWWTVTSQGAMWMYQLSVSRPSSIRTLHRPAAAVLHFVYSPDFSEHWRGRGPISGAGASETANQRLENSISSESKVTTGRLIPVPTTEGTEDLQADIVDLKGASTLVPSTIGGWELGSGSDQAGRSDWNAHRIGPDFTSAEVQMRAQIAAGIASACGVPPSLIAEDVDATSLRESWRQFLHGTVQPVGRLVAEEMSEKLEADISLSFDRLFASDLHGRARSFQSMVNGGMAPDKAAALAGLMES